MSQCCFFPFYNCLYRLFQEILYAKYNYFLMFSMFECLVVTMLRAAKVWLDNPIDLFANVTIGSQLCFSIEVDAWGTVFLIQNLMFNEPPLWIGFFWVRFLCRKFKLYDCMISKIWLSSDLWIRPQTSDE